MRSLKIALPLLTSVAYFVVFAILLFSYVLRPAAPVFLTLSPSHSIIGVQTFQGSFRRTCFVLPAAGETEPVQLDSQLCGGYINATTLRTMPFLRSDGSDGEIKGYICPVGQICMVRDGM
jgi:voltage-dependent calcium channel